MTDSLRLSPPVWTIAKPSFMPAAPDITMAVSSNGPWAVTKLKKFSLCGVVDMWPKTAPSKTALKVMANIPPTPSSAPITKQRRPMPALLKM